MPAGRSVLPIINTEQASELVRIFDTVPVESEFANDPTKAVTFEAEVQIPRETPIPFVDVRQTITELLGAAKVYFEMCIIADRGYDIPLRQFLRSYTARDDIKKLFMQATRRRNSNRQHEQVHIPVGVLHFDTTFLPAHEYQTALYGQAEQLALECIQLIFETLAFIPEPVPVDETGDVFVISDPTLIHVREGHIAYIRSVVQNLCRSYLEAVGNAVIEDADGKPLESMQALTTLPVLQRNVNDARSTHAYWCHMKE